MKAILGVCVVLAIAAGISVYSYLSPQMTLKAIADAARSGDTETMNDLIDFQSVKSNLKDDFEAKIAASSKEQSFGGLLASTGASLLSTLPIYTDQRCMGNDSKLPRGKHA